MPAIELQMRVEERTAELKRTNEQLLAEMAERKRAEDAYYEAQAELARVTRMSALGALAASISHEVNQPLAAVVTNADACMMWLSSEPPNLEEARAAVDCIAQEGTRASEVVRQIRAMFTKAAPERTKVQVNELIREVGALMKAEAAEKPGCDPDRAGRRSPGCDGRPGPIAASDRESDPQRHRSDERRHRPAAAPRDTVGKAGLR